MSDKFPCLWPERGVVAVDWAAACRELATRDPALGAVIARVGGPGYPPPASATAFEALAHSIVYQQLSGKAAATIFGRFRALYPSRRFPEPETVLALQLVPLAAVAWADGKIEPREREAVLKAAAAQGIEEPEIGDGARFH